MTEKLKASLDRLNPEQRRAVDTIDGPLLVIAGPGTGKTQILSLRAANILIERDVSPQSILCLTYTEAGAEAMQKRLVELIGREGYDIVVSTFHGFAASLRKRFPMSFTRSESAKVVSELNKRRMLTDILNGLEVGNPLWAPARRGPHQYLGIANSFIDLFKRSGLTTDEFRRIQDQTKEALAYLADSSDVLDFASMSLQCAKARKREIVAEFEEAVERAVSFAPSDLLEPVVSVPGIYVPYLRWLRDLVRATELIDEDGKATGFTTLRSALFKRTDEGDTFKDEAVCERALALANVYDSYQRLLAERNLYDFQDMISEAIEAISGDPDLRAELGETYQYIQIDEFQDTNGSQMRLAELLVGDGDRPNLMVVGDDDQAIMRFQGASVAYIEQFAERYDPVKVVLKTNYRSTPAVVELGKGIAAQIDTRLGDSATEKDIQAFKGESDQATFVNKLYASKDIEYYELARDIRQRIDEGFIEACDDPDEAIAVIASKHQSLVNLLPYLRHFDIPFSYKRTTNALTMESMAFLLALMRFAVAYARGNAALAESYLPQIVSARELGLDDGEIVEFAFSARREHGWLKAMERSGNGRLKELHDSLVSWAARAPSAPVRELIHEMAGRSLAYYRSKPDDPLSSAEFNSGVRALLKVVQEEADNARQLEHVLRLPEVVDILDALQLYNIGVDASLELGKPGAVRLTSAHSSKGLEFDLVYLIDGDDETWHSSRGGVSFITSNMLIGNDKDEDDMRRLLFVAITRAKRMLEVYSGKGSIARELQGDIETIEQETASQELDDIVEASWDARFDLDSPEAADLLLHHIPRSLSVSALNKFVKYGEGCENSLSFRKTNILRMPEAPSISTSFGSLVHAFLQAYIMGKDRDGFSLESLSEQYREEILWLDFEESEVESCARRFDRVVEHFIPYLDEHLHGNALSEVELTTLLDGKVPLYGIVDLILVDEESRKVELIDFKTGMSHGKYLDDVDYERQLGFYRLLVEAQPRFEGFEIAKSVDLYVEPEADQMGTICEPKVSSELGNDQEHLQQLIKTVWSRIVEGDYDTSAFEASEEFEAAKAKAKEIKASKTEKEKLLQHAYEKWLIGNPSDNARP